MVDLTRGDAHLRHLNGTDYLVVKLDVNIHCGEVAIERGLVDGEVAGDKWGNGGWVR